MQYMRRDLSEYIAFNLILAITSLCDALILRRIIRQLIRLHQETQP
jgi:hypothetical protein